MYNQSSRKMDVRQLEARLADLNYKKSQNRKQIKSVLGSSRQLVRSDKLKQISMDRSAERIDWAHGIIANELAQPLEVTDDFIQEYKERNRRERIRDRQGAKIHVKSLTNLQNSMKNKSREKARLLALVSR